MIGRRHRRRRPWRACHNHRGTSDYILYQENRNPFRVGTPQAIEYDKDYQYAVDNLSPACELAKENPENKGV